MLPQRSFRFERPLILIQSDDWGRAGIRDDSAFSALRLAGLNLGERAYDFYSLETGDDLHALRELLRRHRDSTGRHACLSMNFVLANPDCERMAQEAYRCLRLKPLADGLPGCWHRPGLFEAYKQGIEERLFSPALHGMTHFNAAAVMRALDENAERGALLRSLWKTETSYIYWRMPWIGYEYWDPVCGFVARAEQHKLVGEAVRLFGRMFSRDPVSACAPGYRANHDTQHAWEAHGIRVAQNGPGGIKSPCLDSGILQLGRTFDFEPAVDPNFSLEQCVRKAEHSVSAGRPVVISVHSINFHSTLKDFRSATLRSLDEFLSELERRYPNLLYVTDADMWHIVEEGCYLGEAGSVSVVARQRMLHKKCMDVQVGA
ncbi:MAG TPA: hypothetical protein VFA89_24440 [Terriglobales bacterium]|nr:hypothetical protein [Terriglobales bacterium]